MKHDRKILVAYGTRAVDSKNHYVLTTHSFH